MTAPDPAAVVPARPAITDLSDAELGELVTGLGGKPFQARQLAHWVFRHGAPAFADCRNLPAALQQRLEDWGTVRSSRVEHTAVSADGTEKLLIRYRDGETVESVLIPEGNRNTLCVSSQVGCPVGFVFCASGLDGVRRNLTAGEIVDQVLHARDRLGAARQLTNIVVMGMGEPLLNLSNLEPALARVHDEHGIGIGARRITVSTSGYPMQMRAFARTPHAYQLAVSLHAADDDLRRQLVPTARHSVAEIVADADRYATARRREVTFEVVLLGGVNDRPGDADILAATVADVRCTVNLIPWNPVARISGLRRSSADHTDAFADRLRSRGINVTVRRQRGADRDAACGQLRLRHADRDRSSGA